VRAAKILSPDSMRDSNPSAMADTPEAKATAAYPSFNIATICLNASVVGFLKRLYT
jgi:hypothetical protein